MRLLLTNLLPPQSPDRSALARNVSPSPSAKMPRTFPKTPVFASEDDLLEVGVDGTAMAAPSLSPAKKQGALLARGLASPAKNRRFIP